ncbi:HEAT repeat domain-containing protein [Actinoplanes sp. NPDC051859]|uniref:HEAT repeat domain-containing protein n=1 Tax=Actinoplanes sp. NPDC051859 TaxID=3363909 RepID=UPI0037A93316
MPVLAERSADDNGQAPAAEVWADTEFRRQLGRAVPRTYCRPHFLHSGDDDVASTLPIDLSALVEELTQHRPRTWIIAGGPGSGKTSLAAALAADLLERDTVPVVLDARTWARVDEKSELKDVLLALRPDEIPAPLWKSRIKHKRCVVIIDGLNEISRQFRDAPAWAFAKSIVEGGHPFPVLATMRHFTDEPQESLSRPMTVLDLAPLTDAEVADYLAAVGLDSAAVLRLRTQDDFEDLYSNPLLLSLLANLLGPQSSSASTPPSRGRLLLQTVQRARRQRRLTADEAEIERNGLQLESVMVAAAACALADPGRDQHFARRDVERLLAQHRPDEPRLPAIVDAFLDTQMVVRVEDPGSLDRYRFAHPSFVDFGVALAYRDEDLPEALMAAEELVHCLGDWVGLSADPDESARLVLNRIADDEYEYDRACLVDVVFANRGVLTPQTLTLLWRSIGKALGTALRGRRWQQQSLIQALNQLPEWTIAEGIRLGVLDKFTGPLHAEIADQLAHRTLDVRKLRQAQRRTRDERFETNAAERRQALALAKELGASGSAGPVEALKARLAGADDELAARIVHGIMRLGGLDEMPVLVSTLAAGQSALTRAAAAAALASVGHRDAIAQLMESLVKDESAEVRLACATTLGRLRARQGVGVLAAALADAAATVRVGAARALAELADARTVPALIRALEDEHDHHVQSALAAALGRLRTTEAVPGLIMALTETSLTVRMDACRALGAIRDPAAIPALARRLQDHAGAVRGEALKALGEIGDPSATPHLIEALQHEEAQTRAMAATSLGKIGDPRGIDPVLRALTDDNPYVRSGAAGALGRFPDRRIAARLNEVVRQDPHSAVRSSAISSLGRVGSSRDLPALERVIRDPEEFPWARTVAVMAYGALSSETPMWLAATADELNPAIQNGDPEAQKLRGAIVFCVGRHSNLELIGWLESVARTDPEFMNRTSATSALVRNGRASERFLTSLLSDAEQAVAAGRKPGAAILRIAATEIVRSSADTGLRDPSMLTRLLDIVLTNGKECEEIVSGAVKDNRSSDPRRMLRVLEFIGDRLAAADRDDLIRTTVAGAIEFHRRQIEFAETLAGLRADAGLLPARFEAALNSSAVQAETSVHGGVTQIDAAAGGGSVQVEAAVGGGVGEVSTSREADTAVNKTFAPTPMTEEREPVTDRCDLLVVTVNAVETEAVKKALSAHCGPPVVKHAKINSYWRYHGANLPTIAHLRCGMGGSGVRGAYVQVGDAVRDLRPTSVVAAGVAWGADPAATGIGTVLLSTQVIDFERQRVGADTAGEKVVIARGAKSEASPRLMNRFLVTDYDGTGVTIADGPLLSGEKLIDNPEFKRQLIDLFPDAIGGEMEGAGIQSVCAREQVDWIVVKGVCDFAENKGEDKANRQALAAARSAEALCAVLRQGGFG